LHREARLAWRHGRKERIRIKSGNRRRRPGTQGCGPVIAREPERDSKVWGRSHWKGAKLDYTNPQISER